MAAQVDQKQADPSQIHEFPLPNPKPAIIAKVPFDDDEALKAAKELRNAMKGFGTNETRIIAVTSSYSHLQRLKILATYNTTFKRDLIKDLKSELSGKLEKLCVPFYLKLGLYDAQQIEKAVNGLGFDSTILNEIICTRSDRQLNEMKKAWWKGLSLIDRIQKETTSGHGNYAKLLVNILSGGRAPNGPVDATAAKIDAEVLNRMLSDDKAKAKVKFVEVMTKRSWVQIRAISNMFQEISKKYTLNGAIKDAFGGGSKTAKALCIIDSWSTQPYDYWAKLLKDAMDGMGTNDDLLIRVVVTRSEIDMRNIANIFGQRYGSGKTLSNWIKNDCSGDYEKLLLKMCGYN